MLRPLGKAHPSPHEEESTRKGCGGSDSKGGEHQYDGIDAIT